MEPPAKCQAAEPPAHLWLVDPLSRVHCLQTSVIIERAPESYWARIARNPGTMSQEAPLFVSLPPWFVEAVTSWAQEFGPHRVHFNGHTVAEVGEILYKLAYVGEVNGDIPIDAAYLPPRPKTAYEKDFDQFVDLLREVLHIQFRGCYHHMVEKLKYNQPYTNEFTWPEPNDSVFRVQRKRFKELLARLEAHKKEPMVLTKLAGHQCNLRISIVVKEANVYDGRNVSRGPCDHLCLENTPIAD
jgi:hypothetical protein